MTERCATCGHDRWQHIVEFGHTLSADGAYDIEGWHGRCGIETFTGVGRMVGHRCGCRQYQPHPRPHLAELLGWDVAVVA